MGPRAVFCMEPKIGSKRKLSADSQAVIPLTYYSQWHSDGYFEATTKRPSMSAYWRINECWSADSDRTARLHSSCMRPSGPGAGMAQRVRLINYWNPCWSRSPRRPPSEGSEMTGAREATGRRVERSSLRDARLARLRRRRRRMHDELENNIQRWAAVRGRFRSRTWVWRRRQPRRTERRQCRRALHAFLMLMKGRPESKQWWII